MWTITPDNKICYKKINSVLWDEYIVYEDFTPENIVKILNELQEDIDELGYQLIEEYP